MGTAAGVSGICYLPTVTLFIALYPAGSWVIYDIIEVSRFLLENI